MHIHALYDEQGFTLRVFDDVGFELEEDFFGNSARDEREWFETGDSNALSLDEIKERCTRIAQEKAQMLGVLFENITIQEETDV
ncbi:hypothetical protein F6X40_23940 [Paraburkholderia sp. UCT31]|uniref:hypothetical protein n=1 Tax=Paraburkholderia sp. UCT31 TaxID=2615209 RepID=UPI001655ADF3|nr:hypothetical protein [Paraburkholderia sp. UCT31]MBC8739768.1 hypothetical protein [Paraburkholderia sp. UCT31]